MEYKRYRFTRPLPEACAVMEVVHRRPLDLYMGLHNSNFSGAYFYISEEDELPPHCGEPEVPYLRTLAEGAFHSFALADDYDY